MEGRRTDTNRLQSANAASPTARTDRAPAREHRRADSFIADPELYGDLYQRQAICVKPGGVLPDRVRQLRLASGQARLPGDLPHRAAVHLEACRQLPDWHPGGLPGEQFGPIGNAQTGLRLTRTLTHWAALIVDPSTPRARTASLRSL